jgi:hypothetical protein
MEEGSKEVISINNEDKDKETEREKQIQYIIDFVKKEERDSKTELEVIEMFFNPETRRWLDDVLLISGGTGRDAYGRPTGKGSEGIVLGTEGDGVLCEESVVSSPWAGEIAVTHSVFYLTVEQIKAKKIEIKAFLRKQLKLLESK